MWQTSHPSCSIGPLSLLSMPIKLVKLISPYPCLRKHLILLCLHSICETMVLFCSVLFIRYYYDSRGDIYIYWCYWSSMRMISGRCPSLFFTLTFETFVVVIKSLCHNRVKSMLQWWSAAESILLQDQETPECDVWRSLRSVNVQQELKQTWKWSRIWAGIEIFSKNIHPSFCVSSYPGAVCSKKSYSFLHVAGSDPDFLFCPCGVLSPAFERPKRRTGRL